MRTYDRQDGMSCFWASVDASELGLQTGASCSEQQLHRKNYTARATV